MVAFPKPGDPLIHGTHTLIPAEGRKPPDFSLTTPVANEYQPRIRRSGKEFPADAQTQTVLNAVLMYSLLGMSKNEIAMILNVSIPEVEGLQSMSAYQETFEMLFKELLTVNSSSLQARIASYAARAVDNVFEIADAKPADRTLYDEDGNEVIEKGSHPVPPIVVLKANQDILDRSGLSEEALFGKNSGDDGNSLQIVITSEQDNKTDITINTKVRR
jgi:hypothetical protein